MVNKLSSELNITSHLIRIKNNNNSHCQNKTKIINDKKSDSIKKIFLENKSMSSFPFTEKKICFVKIESFEQIVASLEDTMKSARKYLEFRENEVNQRLVYLGNVKFKGNEVISASEASESLKDLKNDAVKEPQTFVLKKYSEGVPVVRCSPIWVEENSHATHLVQKGVSYKIEKMTEEDVDEVMNLLTTYFEAVSQLQELEMLLKNLKQTTSKPKKEEPESKASQRSSSQQSPRQSHLSKSSHGVLAAEQKKEISSKNEMKETARQMQVVKNIRKSSKKREEVLKKHLKEGVRHKELKKEMETQENRKEDQKGVQRPPLRK